MATRTTTTSTLEQPAPTCPGVLVSCVHNPGEIRIFSQGCCFPLWLRCGINLSLPLDRHDRLGPPWRFLLTHLLFTVHPLSDPRNSSSVRATLAVLISVRGSLDACTPTVPRWTSYSRAAKTPAVNRSPSLHRSSTQSNYVLGPPGDTGEDETACRKMFHGELMHIGKILDSWIS